MDADRWQWISRLYNEALERPVDQRGAFPDACCQGDEVLRGEVAFSRKRQAPRASSLILPPKWWLP